MNKKDIKILTISLSGIILITLGLLGIKNFLDTRQLLGAYKLNPFTQKMDYYESASSSGMITLPISQIYVGNASNQATATSSVTVSSAGVLSASGGTSAQWTTAYGWGNHVSAGYITASTTQLTTSGNIWAGGFIGNLTGVASGNLISGGTLTSAYLCRYDGTGIDCDRVEDASGACATNAVCMGGHTHVGVNEVYAVGWDADTATPEKDDVYDYLHAMDTDDDSSINVLDTDAIDAITEIAAALKDGSGDCGSGLICLGDHTHSSYLTTVDISANTNLTVTAAGLSLSSDAIALTAGYNIPLTASTTEWATASKKIWGVTIASTSPDFIGGGLVAVPAQLNAYTITNIKCYVLGGTSKVVAIEDASANSSEDITCGTTLTADDGTITNASYTAGELSSIDFGATSGAVNYVTISVFGYWQ